TVADRGPHRGVVLVQQAPRALRRSHRSPGRAGAVPRSRQRTLASNAVAPSWEPLAKTGARPAGLSTPLAKQVDGSGRGGHSQRMVTDSLLFRSMSDLIAD